jgi:hypothetical protein
LPSAHEGYYRIAKSLQWRVSGQAGEDAGREAGSLPRSVTLIPFFSIINKAMMDAQVSGRCWLVSQHAELQIHRFIHGILGGPNSSLVRATPCHIYCGRSRGTHSFSGPLLHPHHPIHPTPRSRCCYPREIRGDQAQRQPSVNLPPPPKVRRGFEAGQRGVLLGVHQRDSTSICCVAHSRVMRTRPRRKRLAQIPISHPDPSRNQGRESYPFP